MPEDKTSQIAPVVSKHPRVITEDHLNDCLPPELTLRDLARELWEPTKQWAIEFSFPESPLPDLPPAPPAPERETYDADLDGLQ